MIKERRRRTKEREEGERERGMDVVFDRLIKLSQENIKTRVE